MARGGYRVLRQILGLTGDVSGTADDKFWALLDVLEPDKQTLALTPLDSDWRFVAAATTTVNILAWTMEAFVSEALERQFAWVNNDIGVILMRGVTVC